MLSFHITESADEVTWTTEGESGYQSGELVYSRMSVTQSSGTTEVSELLFISQDMYLRTAEGWFVQSPWTQGVRPEEVPQGGFGGGIFDYRAITNAMEDITQLPDEMIEGVSSEHLLAEADLQRLAGDNEELATLLEDASGTAIVELWLQTDSHVPVNVRVGSDVEINQVRLQTTAMYALEYDQALTLPERPSNARPYRDLLFPEAPCTGAKLAGCLKAQTELEPGSSPNCEGTRRRICLVPLGQISPMLVQHVADHAREEYGLNVVILSPKPLPDWLVDELRGQADGGALTDHLGLLYPREYDEGQVILIGMTPVDLYLPESHFRFTFGVKEVEGRHGVMSSFRMEPEYYGDPQNVDLLQERFRKFFLRYVGMMYFGHPDEDDPTSLLFGNLLSVADLDNMTEPLPVPSTP